MKGLSRFYQAILRCALWLQRRCNDGASFSTLNYHRVLPVPVAGNALPERDFIAQLAILQRYFQVFDLSEALALAQQKRLPANAVVITVDDGYVDCYDTIFKWLQHYQLTATFFITTVGLDDGYLWENLFAFCTDACADRTVQLQLAGHSITLDAANSSHRTAQVQRLKHWIKYQSLQQRQQVLQQLQQQTVPEQHPARCFVNGAQLAEMASAGMTIGAHTVHHPILSQESDDVAHTEIAESQHRLQQEINQTVRYFAYPNGKSTLDYSNKHVTMLKKLGFEAAFSTDWGLSQPNQQCHFQLKRFTPWDSHAGRFALRLVANSLVEHHLFQWLRPLVRPTPAPHGFEPTNKQD